jgi:hypothetical protein
LHSDSACELHDEALSEEIRLLGAVVLAVSTVGRHLTPREVDQILELGGPTPGQRRAGGGHDTPAG